MTRLACIALCTLCFLGCNEQNTALPGTGQWRIINYWAIWCVPCREEIPELNAVNRDTELTVGPQTRETLVAVWHQRADMRVDMNVSCAR
jgi:thiol-disulfide isomerase/thioredoxin